MTVTSSANARFARKDEFVCRRIADETILVPIRDNAGDLDAIYSLGDVASYIWERCDGKTTVQAIIAAICDEYDVAPDVALRDTTRFLAAACEAGLLEAGGGAS